MAKKKIDKRLKTKFSIEDGCPSPDRSGNPFVFCHCEVRSNLKKQKIGTDSGISSKKNYFCKADRLIAC
jgi:hypothetical protein